MKSITEYICESKGAKLTDRRDDRFEGDVLIKKNKEFKDKLNKKKNNKRIDEIIELGEDCGDIFDKICYELNLNFIGEYNWAEYEEWDREDWNYDDYYISYVIYDYSKLPKSILNFLLHCQNKYLTIDKSENNERDEIYITIYSYLDGSLEYIKKIYKKLNK